MTFFVLLAGGSLALTAGSLVAMRGARVPEAENYRGRHLRLVLGPAAGASVLVLLSVALVLSGSHGAFRFRTGVRAAQLLGAVLVLAAGWQDDRRPGRGRGLAGHLREGSRGRLTPGLVKLVVIVAAAAAVALSTGGSVWRVLLGTPVIAGAANAWNLLDVRPARSVKYALVVALALAPFAARHDPVIVPIGFGAALAALPFDLREHAMLGDTGANLLGFLLGVAVFETVPTWGLGVALAFVLLVHWLAETVTLSRVIQAVPVLGWFDALGRLPGGLRAEDSAPS
jgi:UDP-GlcNAc:undecaprenyl-phosphate GlcNAc-1-phosphate transferase